MRKETSGNKVIFNSVIYSCSGILLKCFSFFLLPLYTAYLSAEDYGITSVATSFIGTMSFIVAFSLFAAIKRFYVDFKDDPEVLKRFYGTISSFVFISAIAFGGIAFLCQDLLSKHVFSGVDFYPIILICVVSLAFECQHMIFDGIMRSQQKALKASVSSIAYFLITVIFNVIFVVMLQMGAIGSLLATLIAYFLYTGYFVIEMLLQKTICFCLDWHLLKGALKYSLPIMPHNLSTHIANLFSKVLIGGVASLASLGVYTVAAQFGTIADTVQTYIDQAYGPWLFEKLHAKETGYKKDIRKISNLLSSVVGLLHLGIALFAQDYILLLVDKAYVNAWSFVPWIVLVFSVKTMYYFYVEILFYYKKASRLLFIATLSGSLLNIVLAYLLIPAWSVYGSIAADAIAMAIRVTIIVVVSKRYEDIGLRVRDFLFNFLMVAIFIVGGLSLSIFKFKNTFSLLNFFFKIGVVFLYIAVVFLWYKKDIIPLVKSVTDRIAKRSAKD